MNVLERVQCQNRYGVSRAPKTQLYGCEIELENVLAPDVDIDQRWMERYNLIGVEDGSLRDGWEFLTSPASLTSTLIACRAVQRQARLNDWTGGVRCGIHVHLNVGNLEVENLGGLLATYAAVEPLMFSLCGDVREENIYCVPWYRADQAETTRHLLYDDLPRLGRWATGANKYSALNLLPLRKFGSLEFRHAPTWLDDRPLTRWLCAIGRLARWGNTRTVEEVEAAFESNPNALVRSIFGWTMEHIDDAEALMDKYDTMGVVAALKPYTYKARWRVITVDEDTPALDAGIGYHQTTRRLRRMED